MRNKLNFLKCFIIIFISSFLLCGCSLTDLFSKNKEVSTFNFSGYVFADNLPLVDATVYCGTETTKTDEKGYYSFSNLTKVVEVSASKEGYYFDSNLVYVNSNRNDVNFDGNEFFNINGIVKNGSSVIGGAEVFVTSNSGTKTIETNEQGEFYINELAGSATISASFNDMQFFTKNIDKSTKFVTINSATELNGSIVCDEQVSVGDFVLKLNNQEIDNAIKLEGNKLSFNLKDVAPYSLLTLESSNYHIENNEITITNESGEIIFECQKYYDATISVFSGGTNLEDADILLNEKIISKDDNLFTKLNDKIILNNLYGQNKISAQLNSFNFNTVDLSYENTVADIIGTFNLEVNVLTDNNTYNDVRVFVNEDNKIAAGEVLVFNNVQLNMPISVLTDNYFLENNVQEIVSTQPITLNLQAYYTLNLQALYNNNPINNAKVTIVKNEYSLNTNGVLVVEKLYGENILTLTLNGYNFNSYTISVDNCNIVANANKLFNLTGIVKSGNIIISNAEIIVGDIVTETNENGEFVIENLFESGYIKVLKEGYNEAQVSFYKEQTNIQVNLTYNVTGKIVCGKNFVSDVNIKVGDKTVVTQQDGSFILQNLQGEITISFEKPYYNIESFSCNSNVDNIEVSASYNIEGLVTDRDGNIINNLKIVLSNENANKETTTQNGRYSFTNLTEEYLLTYDGADVSLKPGYYSVTAGGEYNFSNQGYGFSGRVTCGKSGVGGVTLEADNKTVVTDSQGYYTFALIGKPTELILYKEGYIFNNNNLAISEETVGDKTNVNFTCSYSIEGVVRSGSTPIENAIVNINGKEVVTDENGNYNVGGIVDDAKISVTKQGYTFIGERSATGYSVLNYSGFYNAKLKILTGSIAVGGVELIVNDKTYISNNNGLLEVDNVYIGLDYFLNKQNYNFNNYSFLGYTEDYYVIECSYNITGKVYSGITAIENVSVSIKNTDNSCLTNASGEFAFNGLVGENIISFNLQNFQFEDITISAPQTIEAYAKYSVTGIVKVGNNPLSNVKIIAGEFSTLTNGAGRFAIEGLTTRIVLVLEKEGYEFEGQFEVNSPSDLTFSASYCVIGVVKSGDTPVENVLVQYNENDEGVLTDEYGNYIIKGLTNIVTLTFKKDGYKTQTSREINGYTNNLDINLSYSVEVNFSGLDNYSGIYISVNGSRKEYNLQKVILEDLTGANTLVFSKVGYNLSPDTYGVEGYTIINVNIVRYYSANFTIKTDNGILVNDVTVQVGAKTAVPQGNGAYIADELSNKNNVFADLIVLDEQGTTIFNKRYVGPTIDCEGNYSLTINNADYAYFLYTRAYQRLREIYAYKVAVNGTVHPTKLAGDQQVSMTYKKVGTERLYENLNYGNGAAGIEPKVSVLTYTDLLNKRVKYQMVKGSSVHDNLTADYSNNWAEANYDNYRKEFFVSPEGFFPYVFSYDIAKSQVNLGTMSSLSFNNNQYKFTIKFGGASNVDGSVVDNYRGLMEKMVAGQEIKDFFYVNLTFTFDEKGDILTLETDEAYNVFAIVATVKTIGTMTYTYSRSEDTSIPAIDISSNEAIRRTISGNLPQETKNTINALNTYILDKRRELV